MTHLKGSIRQSKESASAIAKIRLEWNY